MSFPDHNIKSEYRSLIDNVVQDFYLPILGDAICYKRAVGFFSSSALAEISKGICKMASHGGKIEIVASPYLSEEDMKAIQQGYQNRETYIKEAILRQIREEDVSDDYYTLERLNLLTKLIEDDILDIKIAYTEKNGGIGMYHEKMGLMEDSSGNTIAFSSSMNESATAMEVNYETIDVFCGWKSDYERDQVALKKKAFDSIWNDKECGIKVISAPEITQALVKKFQRQAPVSFRLDEEQFKKDKKSATRVATEHPIGARMPEEIQLRDYQQAAVAAWAGSNYRGIFSMCTGAGKTISGLAAVAKLSQDLNDCLATIIVCPYQHLVEQWVEDIVKFNIKPIIGYSSSSQKDWKKRLEKAIRDQRMIPKKSFFCLVCTNATFSSAFVQEQIDKIKAPILLMVDEAHNFGAQRIRKLLDDRFTYRLALSATMDRHRDEEGTAALYNFFGKKCIDYTLEQAIRDGKLTPYKYYPVVVYLSDDELEKYSEISSEMAKHIIQGRSGNAKLDSYGEMLAIKRSRVVAGAIAKISELRKQIEPYKNQNNILVYCGATNILDEKSDDSDVDSGDIKQIDAVTHMLGNELGMRVARFTSRESIEERTTIKEKFQDDGKLQAIVAIKCLDEGVNIPGIKTAFILASTTNPKEYIQRRGRVLRKAPGKSHAEIYDFVTLPRPLDEVPGLTIEQANRDVSLVKNECARMQEFAAQALNGMDAQTLIWDIQEVYHIETIEDVGVEAEFAKEIKSSD